MSQVNVKVDGEGFFLCLVDQRLDTIILDLAQVRLIDIDQIILFRNRDIVMLCRLVYSILSPDFYILLISYLYGGWVLMLGVELLVLKNYILCLYLQLYMKNLFNMLSGIRGFIN